MTKGIVIALLANKQRKKTHANQPYYLLSLTGQKNLTNLYFQLTKKPTLTLKNNATLYLFNDQNKWGHKLVVNHCYCFQFQKRNNYLHLEDWKILGDQLTVKRAWKLLKEINPFKNKKGP